MLCGHFEHQRRVQFEGSAAEPLQTITAILLGSIWSCLLLRIVLHNAQIEVMKVYPPMLMMVFVYDFTISLVGRNKDLPKVAERIFKNVQEVVEAKGSTMSITTQGKEETSRVIVSCKHLEGNCKEHNEKEGVRPAESAETLGVDLSTGTVKLGAREKDENMCCKIRHCQNEPSH